MSGPRPIPDPRPTAALSAFLVGAGVYVGAWLLLAAGWVLVHRRRQ